MRRDNAAFLLTNTLVSSRTLAKKPYLRCHGWVSQAGAVVLNAGQVGKALKGPDGPQSLKKSFFTFVGINNCCIRIEPGGIIDDILTIDKRQAQIKNYNSNVLATGTFVYSET